MKNFFLLAHFGFVLVACSSTVPNPSELNELRHNRDRWAAQQPMTYEFVLQRVCECIPPWSTPLRITVHEGQIQSVVNDQTDEPIPVDAEQVEGIEDLFSLLEEALDDAFRVTAEYDPDLGYPTSIFIDYDQEMVDEELVFTLRDLQAVN